jgi:hypothetical protein
MGERLNTLRFAEEITSPEEVVALPSAWSAPSSSKG